MLALTHGQWNSVASTLWRCQLKCVWWIYVKRSASPAVITPSDKLMCVRFLITRETRNEKLSWSTLLVCCENTGTILNYGENYDVVWTKLNGRKFNKRRFSPHFIANKYTGIVVLLHTNRAYGRMELQIHSFLILAVVSLTDLLLSTRGKSHT